MIMISNCLFIFINFCVIVSFCSGNIAAVVAKLVMRAILPLTSFILALTLVLVVTLAISGILSSIFFILHYIHPF